MFLTHYVVNIKIIYPVSDLGFVCMKELYITLLFRILRMANLNKSGKSEEQKKKPHGDF